jgi:hypothetical protein
VEAAPRVRVRSAADKARDQLADLAVVNARLAGSDEGRAAEIRKRLDYLRRRRRNWEMVYQVGGAALPVCACVSLAGASANREAE